MLVGCISASSHEIYIGKVCTRIVRALPCVTRCIERLPKGDYFPLVQWANVPPTFPYLPATDVTLTDTIPRWWQRPRLPSPLAALHHLTHGSAAPRATATQQLEPPTGPTPPPPTSWQVWSWRGAAGPMGQQTPSRPMGQQPPSGDKGRGQGRKGARGGPSRRSGVAWSSRLLATQEEEGEEEGGSEQGGTDSGGLGCVAEVDAAACEGAEPGRGAEGEGAAAAEAGEVTMLLSGPECSGVGSGEDASPWRVVRGGSGSGVALRERQGQQGTQRPGRVSNKRERFEGVADDGGKPAGDGRERNQGQERDAGQRDGEEVGEQEELQEVAVDLHRPSVGQRKTVNAVRSDGRHVSVLAQHYAVLVTDVRLPASYRRSWATSKPAADSGADDGETGGSGGSGGGGDAGRWGFPAAALKLLWWRLGAPNQGSREGSKDGASGGGHPGEVELPVSSSRSASATGACPAEVLRGPGPGSYPQGLAAAAAGNGANVTSEGPQSGAESAGSRALTGVSVPRQYTALGPPQTHHPAVTPGQAPRAPAAAVDETRGAEAAAAVLEPSAAMGSVGAREKPQHGNAGVLPRTMGRATSGGSTTTNAAFGVSGLRIAPAVLPPTPRTQTATPSGLARMHRRCRSEGSVAVFAFSFASAGTPESTTASTALLPPPEGPEAPPCCSPPNAAARRWALLRQAVASGAVASLSSLPSFCPVSATFRRLFPDDFDRAVPLPNHRTVDRLLQRLDEHVGRLEQVGSEWVLVQGCARVRVRSSG